MTYLKKKWHIDKRRSPPDPRDPLEPYRDKTPSRKTEDVIADETLGWLREDDPPGLLTEDD